MQEQAATAFSPERSGGVGLADELRALHEQARADMGESDLAQIRTVQAYIDAMHRRSLELLQQSGAPSAWWHGVVLHALQRVAEFFEVGHPVLHGSFDHLPDAGQFHSQRYDWGYPCDIRDWKVSHHQGHHPFTNIVAKDHDLGFGFFRSLPGQDWFGHHVFQLFVVPIALPLSPFLKPFVYAAHAAQDEGRSVVLPSSYAAALRVVLREVIRRYIREPLQARPSRVIPTLLGNYVGAVLGNGAVIYLGGLEHAVTGVEVFPDPGPDESADDYCVRQLRSTLNLIPHTPLDDKIRHLLHEELDFPDPPDVGIFYGALTTHVEHHLMPDLSAERQRLIAPLVREVVERHGLHYGEVALADVAPLLAKAMLALSLPLGERENGRLAALLRKPKSLLRRGYYGLAYRRLPESPYLDKIRTYNVPVQVSSVDRVAAGQACVLRLERPEGWQHIGWEAGAFVSVRVQIGEESLVRQYSLVRDSSESDFMEICVKRVPDGRVSNLLNGSMRPGRWVTLVGPPTTTGGFHQERLPEKSLFIAGGVGITPVISLIRRLAREAPDSDMVLMYFNRDPASIIFARELRAIASRSRTRVHFFCDVVPDRSLGVVQAPLSRELIAQYVPDAVERDAYVCAPTPMMSLARRQLAELGVTAERFHAESFVTEKLNRPPDDGQRFTIRFRRSQKQVETDRSTTLLEAARAVGLQVPSGCERGLCRACVSVKLSGRTQMSDDTGQSRVTVCNSLPCTDIDLDL